MWWGGGKNPLFSSCVKKKAFLSSSEANVMLQMEKSKWAFYKVILVQNPSLFPCWVAQQKKRPCHTKKLWKISSWFAETQTEDASF